MTPADESYMRLALANAASVRLLTSPNPWVGCVIVTPGGDVFQGATAEPGGLHAEREALQRAGAAARGATLYSTLEPCCHHGRTPPCTDAIVAAGVRRVVFAVRDPDPKVAGGGAAQLREAAIEVCEGVLRDEAAEQLAAYVVHRATGRPFVVLKLALTLDGFLAAADGSSNWITGPEARADAHRLRAESDAIAVGAGTVRRDDPALTVRDFSPAGETPASGIDPLRVVLGAAPPGARVHPALEWVGSLEGLLAELGSRGVIQLLVEGGGDVAGRFHRAGLVDRYVLYLAPVLHGGDDGVHAFRGPGAVDIAHVTRGRFVSVDRFGDDVRLIVAPPPKRPGG